MLKRFLKAVVVTGNCNLLKSNYLSQSIRFYKAAILREFGKPLQIADVKPQKKLAKEEIRIKTEACGVNISDILICRGEYDYKPKLPFTPGFEVSGIISEIGSKIKNFHVGDRVVAVNKEKSGGFAQECVAPSKDVWRLPPRLSFEEAASLVDSYGLAYLALGRRAKLKKDDVVVITAAAGGLGLAAVDIAANVYQAKVIGVCGTESKAERVREKGAWAALKYDRNDVVDTVNEVSNGEGARVIFDAVGGEIFEHALACVAHEGQVIVAGFASRVIPSIKTVDLLPKSFSLIGVSLTHYRENANEIYRDTLEEVIKMADEKYIEPNISAKYKLEEVNEAFQHILDRKSTGKVIILCS